jgi:hypothetical protein
MSTYSSTVSNAALSTSADILTITPAASRQIQLVEVSIGGMATASAANELSVSYVTTAGITPGAGVINKFGVYAPAAASTVAVSWATQPLIANGSILRLPVNANGGIYRWVARPGEEINAVGGLAGFLGLSFRGSIAGGNVTITCIWVEDPL